MTTENITHPQIYITIRTLRLETSKRGRPSAPHCPSSAGSSQRDLDTPIPKEFGLPSLEGGGGECQVVRIEKRNPEWWQLKDKGKACEYRTKEGPRTGVRPSGKVNVPPGQPNLPREGSGRGGKPYKKKRQNWASGLSSLPVFWVGLPSHLEYIFSFACQIKLSCSTSPSVASNFTAARQNRGNYKLP